MLRSNKQLQHVNGTARRAGPGDGQFRTVYSGFTNGRSSATGLEALRSSGAVHMCDWAGAGRVGAWTVVDAPSLFPSLVWSRYPTGVLCPLPQPQETPRFPATHGLFQGGF